MPKILQYDFHEAGNSQCKAIVAIHGWQGDRKSMYPIIKMLNNDNFGCYQFI